MFEIYVCLGNNSWGKKTCNRVGTISESVYIVPAHKNKKFDYIFSSLGLNFFNFLCFNVLMFFVLCSSIFMLVRMNCVRPAAG
jgi:hypothetical protein